ncbi:interleukin 17a/f1 [Hippoglossus hippoglossus]|uniref:interleukin 17a/f1 n=1 Tax=Hippoglossus hippoglossus TaxID=8267 RepID=UPI00148DC9A4|nr:interleukin 17a/f1 [Hippoglossus hippoglossus]
MFLTSNSNKVMAACVVAMMMMMMMSEAGAMPRAGGQSKHSARTRNKTHDAAAGMVPLQLDPRALVPITNIRPLENASISPWTYNHSHDASLLPPVLSEARCLLQGCLNLEGVEDQSLQSRPIMHQVMMLRRVKSAAAENYHYKLESRIIAVGCTCVRPTIQQQQ